MNSNLYSNTEFTNLVENINHEILRRGTYRWWDPLTIPSIGIDKTPATTLPEIEGEKIFVDERSYTINNPSSGSIESTRNELFPAQGNNPAGQLPNKRDNSPNTSAAQLNVDELKNMLVGLSKIQDINLFYGRDEIKGMAFRDPAGIEEAVINAQNSELNAPLHLSDISPTKNDPNGGITTHRSDNYPEELEITYPKENGIYVMPSGEYDGEEANKYSELGPDNFYDDYGAEPGDSNYHPMNRYTSKMVRRDWIDQDHDRNEIKTVVVNGGIKSSSRFGPNPRNPEMGDPYKSRPVYGGKKGSCNAACTGLCFTTCDNQCSESCSSTCFSRCGNVCTATCGNVCTGCSTMCYQSCKTKCENSTGYSCVKAGAKTVKVETSGGTKGQPAKNTITISTHTCKGCSFSCQFYPNKKTECWDSGCMGKCFTSCESSCSTSCFGGCINNDAEEGTSFKTGKGQGCSGGCTLNCIGACSGVCEGYCVQTCFNSCKQMCSDNCSWTCSTNCGNGCEQGCTSGCTGCASQCESSCRGQAVNSSCSGCGTQGGCTSSCKFDCNTNCMGWGCRSICGIDAAGACESNCRLSCMGTSCTAMCSDACSTTCSSCVNTCGFQCGACSSECSTDCGRECNINCHQECALSCSENCVSSCSEACGGCSNLCYSCVGMCIGVCSVRCENGCSLCANQCSHWCDITCNRACMATCSDVCIKTCTGSCATFLTSNTTMTKGPERKPTSNGFIYFNPKNRWEERESFKLFRDPVPYKEPPKEIEKKLITIAITGNNNFFILETHNGKEVDNVQRIWELDVDNNVIKKISTNRGDINPDNIENIYKYYKGEYVKVKPQYLREGFFVYIWDIDTYGIFQPSPELDYLNRDKNLIVIRPDGIQAIRYQTSINSGVYNIDKETGEITINEDMLPGNVEVNLPNLDKGGGLLIIKILNNPDIEINDSDIEVILPFEFEACKIIRDSENNIIVIIQKDQFLFPDEK